MAAANTDLVTEVGSPGTATTLASPGHTSGGNSITVGATTNWPTVSGVVFAMDQVQTVNGVTSRVPGTYTEWIGVVNGATGVINMVLLYGTDQDYPAGSTSRVYIPVASSRENRLAQAIMQDHDRRGRHVQLTDTNGNKIVGLSPTASAVNDVAIANATTGNAPGLVAEGTDTDIGVQITTKGKGGFKVKGRHDGWSDLSGFGTFTVVSNNGNKDHTVNTPTDLSSFLQVGHKVAFNRTVAPPTQCMAFVGANSQYASKASAAGITFTGTHTMEAWIYLNSYPASGGQMAIIGKWNNASTTGGFGLRLQSTGQLDWFYGTTTNFTAFRTYQAIPLKKWVHVAVAVTDLVNHFATAYINGASVPVYSTASASTTLTQDAAANLAIAAAGGTPGTWGAGSSTYFDGYISEARIWSTAQSQANILANMSISLTGSETNLVALFQGNGNFNDKTANANTLTAQGGAIATQAANPYNATEYGWITQVSSTQIHVYTGNKCSIPASGGIISPAYSRDYAPLGFPAQTTFSLSALDATVAANLVAAGITDHPIDNLIYINTGTAGGSMYLTMIGNEKRISGFSVSLTQAANTTTSYSITLPSGFVSLLESVVYNIASASGSVGQNGIIGNVFSTSSLQFYMMNSTASPGVGGTVGYMAVGI